MNERIQLTEAEKLAKKHFLLILKEAQKVPCDFSLPIKDEGVPLWYNEELYERAQKFYRKNRAGFLYSNLIALTCLFAVPEVAQILKLTRRSSSPEVAKKRYLDTIIHILTWYDTELSSDTRNFYSLNKVRRLHYLSSKSAEKKEIGFISQAELVITMVGLMGFILTRPKLLKIQSDDDDLKAISHFWSVIAYMLGVHDRFNIHHLLFDAQIVFCQMITRYVFLPIIQLETTDFIELTKAMLSSISAYMPLVSYEVDLFCTRMLCMVPGYQHNVDYSQELLCRSIIMEGDVNEIKESLTGAQYYDNRIKSYLSVDVPVFKIVRGQYVNGISQGLTIDKEDGDPELIEFVRKVMKLGPFDHISVKYINYEKNWKNSLNDSKYKELSIRARLNLMFRYLQLAIYNTSIGRFILNYIIEKILQLMKNT